VKGTYIFIGCVLDIIVCGLSTECSSPCGSCQPDDQTMCKTCQYLINCTQDNCLDKAMCDELGFEVGETGCGEL